jgi:hypothetical protein
MKLKKKLNKKKKKIELLEGEIGKKKFNKKGPETMNQINLPNL